MRSHWGWGLREGERKEFHRPEGDCVGVETGPRRREFERELWLGVYRMSNGERKGEKRALAMFGGFFWRCVPNHTIAPSLPCQGNESIIGFIERKVRKMNQ